MSANADDINIADCTAKVLLKNKGHDAFNGFSGIDLVPITTDSKESEASSGCIPLTVLNLNVHQFSGSGGCVMNPSAGFGFDWALLAIVMLIGFLRSRMK